jgi:putative heme-binding domain-containing protein
MITKTFVVNFFLLIGAFAQLGIGHADPIHVLMVEGQHNHAWKATTPELKRQLLATGRFSIDVATTPAAGAPSAAWSKFAPVFSKYDVVLLNYFGADWPAASLEQLEQFVHMGGGLATFHAGGSSFAKRANYNRMIGLAWRKRDFGPGLAFDAAGQLLHIARGQGMDSGHGAMTPFDVVTRAPEHPIMKNMSARWTHVRDELYHGLRGPSEQIEILATAHSPITGLDEPMAWTVRYGEGRVFVTALGHDVTAMRGAGFEALMAHGVEWCARGTVSRPGMLKPLPSTILANIDETVRVHGAYAAVKLPITNGVPLHNPTAVTVGPGGFMYVANYTGQILRLEDTDGDGLEDTTVLYADIRNDGKAYPFADAAAYPGSPQGPGLRYPTALLFKGDDCYVTSTQEIRIYRDTDGDGVADTSRTFATGWPFTMHWFDWTFGLQFGPDGWLYTILCTDYGNAKQAPDPDGLRGSVLRISPDGKTIERFAYGLRYPYGLAFNDAGDLFFSDNEGGGNATEEINHAVKGGNYGHRPKLATAPARNPILRITSHMSANGLAFNPAGNDFGGTAGDLFVACWGPDGQWRRGSIVRARLTRQAEGTYAAKQFPFADGPGKVIALCFAPSGDLYVARFGPDKNPGHIPTDKPEGNIYRFLWQPDLLSAHAGARATVNVLKNRADGDPVKGKEIATQRICFTCHTTDGSGDLVGPDLKDVWAAFGREGVMESLTEPSKVIASGYDAHTVATMDTKTFTGRLLSAEDDGLTLLLADNTRQSIARTNVTSVGVSPVSLMPPGLINGLDDAQVEDLLAYLRALGGDEPGPLRINVGGPAMKEPGGDTWEADIKFRPGFYGYEGGLLFGTAVGQDPRVHTSRYGNFNYRFDVDNGAYEVTLIFSEPYFSGPGRRVFSVMLQDQVVLDRLDPFREAGFSTALSKTFPVTVTDGKIKLAFSAVANLPLLSAIEVKPFKDQPK